MIKSLVQRYKELDKEYDNLYNILGCQPDCKLFDPIFKMLDNYIDAVSLLVKDDFNWISWYIFENSCGKDKKEATSIGLENPCKINNIKKLVKLIEGKI